MEVEGVNGLGPFTRVTCSRVEGVISISAAEGSGDLKSLGILINTKEKEVASVGFATTKGFSLISGKDKSEFTINSNQVKITGTGVGVVEDGTPFADRKFSVEVTCK